MRKLIFALNTAVLSFITQTGCALPIASTGQVSPATAQLNMASELEDGADFSLEITGLPPRENVRLHSLRTMSKWVQGTDGQWRVRDVVMHAWADFLVNRQGRLNPARVAPTRGTWRSAGTMPLFWAGYPLGAAELEIAKGDIRGLMAPAGGSTLIAITQGDSVLAQGAVKIVRASGVSTRQVREAGLVGVFAAPKDARGLPVIVLLHGSEGGKLDNAAADASRFAAQGYAVLAVTYFSYPYEAIPGTPNAHVNIPIETLERARDFLARQPEADEERFGVYGVSKGAEFAALAASRYPWIDAVVPCVGSDVAWEGYGIEPRPNPPPSSWSWQGQSLPAIELIPYVEGDPRFKTNTQRYDLSRAQNSAANIAAARIPIENARAQFLFLSGDRDKVWASGTMSRAMHATLRNNGKGHQSHLKTYPLAGHNICGSGLFPVRLYGVQGHQPYDPDLTAEGEAAVDAWEETKAFFASNLKKSN